MRERRPDVIVMYLLLFAALLHMTAFVAPEGDWTVARIPDTGHTPYSIVFADEKTGWISGSFPGVLKTTDGGGTWSRLQSNLTRHRISTLWFATRIRGWALASSLAPDGGSTKNTILSTENGGLSWTERFRLEGGACPLVDVWFMDGRHGWVAGSCHNQAVIWASSDGGRNWAEQYRSEESSGPELRRVRFANATRGWAVGPRTILHTNDGGKRWISQYNGPDGIWLNDLAILNGEEALAVGGWGFLLRTTNHGQTWTPVSLSGTRDFVWRIEFADAKHGWLTGAKGEIYATTDGGQTWLRQESPVDSMLSDIAITSSRVFITASPTDLLVLRRR